MSGIVALRKDVRAALAFPVRSPELRRYCARNDGDYPVLDRRPYLWDWLRRQAGALALIGVVSVHVVPSVFFRNAFIGEVWADTSHVVPEAKLGAAKHAETIAIPNLAPDIQPAHTSIAATVKSAAFNSLRSLPHFDAGRDNIVTLEPVIFDFELPKESVVTEHSVNEPSDISGGQVTYILKAYIAGEECLPARETTYSQRVYAHVGALDNFGVPLLGNCSVARGGPQTARREPQSEREGSDGNRAEGGNRPLVVVKKFSDMPEPDKRRVIGGAIFVAGVIGLAAYLAIHGNQ